jgi:hypothetical protein
MRAQALLLGWDWARPSARCTSGCRHPDAKRFVVDQRRTDRALRRLLLTI